MATQDQVVQILGQLKAQGEDMGALQKRLSSMDPSDQHTFFDHLAGQLQQTSMPAQPPKQNQMSFTPDNPNASVTPDQPVPTDSNATNPSNLGDTVSNAIGTPEQLGKNVTQNLPMIGGVIGGALGAGAGGVGAFPGAAAGGAAGASLEGLIKSVAWPEEMDFSAKGQAGNLVKGAVTGIINETGGRVLSEAAGMTMDASKVIGDKLGGLAQTLAPVIGRSAVGATAGYALAGPTGAKVGAVAGALGAPGVMTKLLRTKQFFTSPAAQTIPALVADNVENTISVNNSYGRALGESYKDVDAFYANKDTTVAKPYRNASSMAREVKANLQAKDPKGLHGDDFYSGVDTVLNDKLNLEAQPGREINAEVLHGKVKDLNSSYKGVATPDSLKSAKKAVAIELRGILDDYVVKTENTELVQQVTKNKNGFSTTAEAANAAKTIQAKTDKVGRVQAGLDEVHRVLAQGPQVIGKQNYNKLHYAMTRGTSALLSTYAYTLMNNQKFSDTVNAINLKFAVTSPQANQQPEQPAQ